MKEIIDPGIMDLIEAEMKDLIDSRGIPKPLYDMMRYHLGWLDENLNPTVKYGGKRFRPLLCLLSYYTLSGVYDKAIPAAAAIELVHNFSLIHDDIEDRDEERRHVPTVWKIWGEAQAINAGDGMHVLANLAALRLLDYKVTPQKVVTVLENLNLTVITLCEGQYLDISFENRNDVSTDEYLDMIYRKTGALIESALVIGATLASNEKRVINEFRNYGRHMGMAFQIRDDIIGTWGDTTNTGKPKGSDIENKKKTLPVIYTFEKAEASVRAELEKLYTKEKLDKEDVQFVMNVMEDLEAYDYALRVATEYERTAINSLKKLNLNQEAYDKLLTVTNFLIKRDY